MSQIFPPTSGGAERMCSDLNLPLLGKVPLDPRIARSCDEGKSFLREVPDSPAAKVYQNIVQSEFFFPSWSAHTSIFWSFFIKDVRHIWENVDFQGSLVFLMIGFWFGEIIWKEKLLHHKWEAVIKRGINEYPHELNILTFSGCCFQV